MLGKVFIVRPRALSDYHLVLKHFFLESNAHLVGGLEYIIPTAIFQRGSNHQPVMHGGCGMALFDYQRATSCPFWGRVLICCRLMDTCWGRYWLCRRCNNDIQWHHGKSFRKPHGGKEFLLPSPGISNSQIEPWSVRSIHLGPGNLGNFGTPRGWIETIQSIAQGHMLWIVIILFAS